MRSSARFFILSILVSAAAGTTCHAGRVMGEVTRVTTDSITATFPAPVRDGSMVMVMSGKDEPISGMAVTQACHGSGPYQVTGKIYFISDTEQFAAGKQAYVNSANAGAIPSNVRSFAQGRSTVGDEDLKFYYYAAGQNVGYGAFGLGYERNIRLVRGVSLDVDGGITTVGNLGSSDASVVNTDQLVKTANGRLRFDLGRDLGVYSGYRFSEGSGDQQSWDRLSGNLAGKTFAAPSSIDSGTVRLQGLEYGLSLRPVGKFIVSLGYIPKLRADYGGIGVRDMPGYTGELRFGTGKGALRLRGLKSDGYWSADLGLTIQ